MLVEAAPGESLALAILDGLGLPRPVAPPLGDSLPSGPAAGAEADSPTSSTAIGAALDAAGIRLLAVDDLDTSDEPSRALLTDLCESPTFGHLTVLAATLSARGGLDILARSPRASEQASAHVLQPLSPDDVHSLIRSLGLTGSEERLRDDAERIHEQSGGNAFLVQALIRSLASSGRTDDLPPGIVDMVARVRAGFPGEVRRTLDTLALLERDTRVPDIADLLDLTPATLMDHLELFAIHGLLTFSGGGSTPDIGLLVRNSVIDLLGRSGVRLRHLEIARRAGDLPFPRARLVAAHLRASGDLAEPVETARWLVRAAEEHARDHDTATAHALLLEAVTTGQRAGAPDEEVQGWRLLLAEALLRLGRIDTGCDLAYEVAMATSGTGARGIHHRAAIMTAGSAFSDGADSLRVTDLLDPVVRDAHATPGERAEALEALARATLHLVDVEAATRHAWITSELRSLLGDLGEPTDRARALLGLHHAQHALGEPAAGRLVTATEATRAAHDTGRPHLQLLAMQVRAQDAIEADRDEVPELMEAYRRAALSARTSYHLWRAWVLTAEWSAWTGSLASRRAAESECAALATHLDPYAVEMAALAQRVSALWREGDFAGLATLLGGARVDLAHRPVARAAELAAQARAGRTVMHAEVEAVAGRLTRHGLHVVGHAFVLDCLTSLGDPMAEDGFAASFEVVLSRRQDLLVIEGGAGIFGRISTFLPPSG